MGSEASCPHGVPLLPPVPGQNACITHPCSLLCLPKSNNGRSCKCPEGVSSSVLPTGEVRCDCPRGYVMKNTTCLKEGKTELCSCLARWQPLFQSLSCCPLGEEESSPLSQNAASCLLLACFCFPLCTRKHVSAQPVQMLQWELHQQHLAV